MPRKHVHVPGTRYRRNYSLNNLERALKGVIERNMSFQEAAEVYQVPKSTIFRRYKELNSDILGRPPVLNKAEENQIVIAMTTAAKFGYPFTTNELTIFVKQYLDRKGVRTLFKNNLPGNEWCINFMNRNPELSSRNSENIKRVRAEMGPEVVSEYFDNLSRTLENVQPENIVNYDETNFADDPGKIKILVRRGSKHAHRIIDPSKSSVSVMFSVTGAGTCLPPYIVYKAKNLYPEWLQGGPEGCYFNRNESGWFDAITFEDWFQKIAIPYFRRLDGKKVIIGDNLGSHLSLEVLQLCENNNIEFVFLPPNSTHLLQPLDVSVFRSTKASWRKNLNEWKQHNKGCIPKTQFPALLRTAIEDTKNNSQNIIAGFTACGIIPIDRTKILNKLIPKGLETVATDALNGSFENIMGDLLRVTESPKIKRKRKINIPPDTGIRPEDLPKENAVPSQPKKRGRPKVINMI